MKIRLTRDQDNEGGDNSIQVTRGEAELVRTCHCTGKHGRCHSSKLGEAANAPALIPTNKLGRTTAAEE